MLIRLVVALAVAATLCSGQAPAEAKEDPGLVIRAETNLVLVPLHVSKGKTPVTGLGSDAFEVLEDGQLQDIALVDGPVGPGEDAAQRRRVQKEIIFLIDMSANSSNWPVLDDETIRKGMLDGLTEDFQFSIYGIGSTLRYFTGPTRDPGSLARALQEASMFRKEGSAVFEGIYNALGHAAARGGNVRRTLFVFSDGVDTTTFEADHVVAVATILGIPVNPVVVGGLRADPGGFSAPQAQGTLPSRTVRQRTLRGADSAAHFGKFVSLDRKTGGRRYDIDRVDWMSLRRVTQSISRLARTEYLVGYRPRNVDTEITVHEATVRLKDNKIGKLQGARRSVYH